ncbi:MAG TPA: RusA family crossover junction endodeoxyribonuclease [Microvirga sp.]|jgi:crossover junction endodeoxyribonuclease RusA|nr:RusA family crossover junction endodeoxyribonuclease [Microvirga sp.]
MIQAVLPYPPSVNRLWRYAGAGRAYLSDEGRTWKDAAAWIVKAHLLKGSTPVLGPFHFHMEVGRPDRRQRDLDNLFKAVLDAAEAGGAIRNDSDAQSLFAQWVPDLKGIRITITSAEGTAVGNDNQDTWESLGDVANRVVADLAKGRGK